MPADTPTTPHADPAGRLRRALALTTMERYFGLILNFVTMAAVSRILTPSEIGVAVIGWAILSVPYALRDMGTMDFIIQRRDLTPHDTRTAATVGILTATTLVAAIFGITPFVVSAYGDPRLGQFLNVMVFAILTDAFGSPLVGLMRRQLEFGRVALVNLTLAIVTALVTVGFAILGFSYMCVAWAGLLGNACAAFVAICIKREVWVFRPALKRWRDIVGFGGYYCTMAFMLRLYEAVPYLALGRFMPTATTGYYNRAVQLCQLPEKVILSGIVAVAFPALAAEAREGRELKPAYLRAIEYVTAVQWPGLILLACLAPTVVALVYGHQWLDVVPLVQIMAVGSIIGANSVLTYPILYAAGALRHALLATVLSLGPSSLILVLGARYGATALALSMCAAISLNTFVMMQFIRRNLDFTWHEVWMAVRKSVVVLAFSAIGPLLVMWIYDAHAVQPLPAQALILALAGLGWLCALHLTAHPFLAELSHLMSVVRSRFPALLKTRKARFSSGP
jgi:O-antigen/teichoic acid export membrane protein